MEEAGIIIGSGTVGALCTLAASWIKAKFGTKSTIKAEPSPFPVQEQGPYVTIGECKQHRCALEKRIDDQASIIRALPGMIEDLDRKAEKRSFDLHRRIDPVIEKVAANSAKVDMLQDMVQNSSKAS